MFNDAIKRLADEGEVPAYLLDVETLQSNYRDFQGAFGTTFEKFCMAYSYKTNYVPWLCKWMHRQGALAEVVSGMEYQLAREFGVPGEQIIFNGPAKKKSEILQSLEDGAVINLDSLQEVESVLGLVATGLCKNLAQSPRLGLRLNFALGGNLGGESSCSHFGLSIEDGEADQAVEMLHASPGLSIISLHGHRSTPQRHVGGFQSIAECLANFALSRLGENELQYLNVGGGFGRNVAGMGLPHFPSASDYAEGIATSLGPIYNDRRWPTIVIEPGLCLAGSPFYFLSQVQAIKVIGGERYAILDASFHNLKPSLHRFNLPIQVFNRNGEKIEGDSGPITMAGYTCMESDILGRYDSSPEINSGDIIAFANAGAYTIVFNPQFIRERPPIFALLEGRIIQIRRRETVPDILQLYPEDRRDGGLETA